MEVKPTARWGWVAALVVTLCGCHSPTPEITARRLAASHLGEPASDPQAVAEAVARADRLVQTGFWKRKDFDTRVAPPFVAGSHIKAAVEALRTSGTMPCLSIWVPMTIPGGHGRVMVWDHPNRMDDWAALIERLEREELDALAIEGWIDREIDLINH